MVKSISKVALAAGCLLALAVFTPQAKAGGVTPDTFSCHGGVGTCGSVVVSGGGTIFSASNIPTVADMFPQQTEEVGDDFALSFNTSTKAISLTDTSDGDAFLQGTITSFSFTPAASTCNSSTPPCDGTLTLNVNWYNEELLQGTTTVFQVNVANGVAADGRYQIESASISATTPEPASLLLMGTGLLAFGGIIRRRWLS